ncbi:MAG: hypothetical protein KC708_18260 [Anaerolineae bacterium]|nr:hypothetical protein [Anaerolineae bacterium]
MRRTGSWWLMMIVVVGTWFVQLAMAYGITRGTMAPWEGFWYQPNIDWEIALNDIFVGPGAPIITVIVMLVSVAFFLRIYHRDWHTILRYALTNLGFTLMVPFVYLPALFVNMMVIPTFPGDTPFPTYYELVFPVFSMLVMFLIWVMVLATVTQPDKRKRKHKEVHTLTGEELASEAVIMSEEPELWADVQTKQVSIG